VIFGYKKKASRPTYVPHGEFDARTVRALAKGFLPGLGKP
jgi:hypothetical protein